MAAESDRNDDILRLNALVDGELSATERAELAARLAADRDLARAHATLAQLKASVLASADAAPVPKLAIAPRRRWLSVTTAAAAVTAAALLVALFAPELRSDREMAAEAPHTIVELAALPASSVVPDLADAGLKLAGVAMETPGGVMTVVATYRGPRGCRLVLRVHPANSTIPGLSGTGERSWTVGDLTYELTAYGMPAGRFNAVAAAAEAATRNRDLRIDSRKLRQASAGSPPCVG